jgi:hypothetical protein
MVRLTIDEASAARKVLKQNGDVPTARLFGLYSIVTMWRALAEAEVSRSTADSIRARLRDHPAEE